jgi:FixJ family two-component response regulator
MSRPIVFIVDDDVSVRESLTALIRFAGWPVAAFASAQAFLDYRRTPGPACLVLDVSLPDFDGLELQRRLSENRAELPIVFITGIGDIPTSVRAMKAGALEFLTKPFEDDVLLAAIANAIERSTAAQEEHASLARLRSDYETLTGREREVMALIATGLLNKQVGGELGISEITVKAHRGQVMRKMKAHSFAELVSMAARLGLAAPPQH